MKTRFLNKEIMHANVGFHFHMYFVFAEKFSTFLAPKLAQPHFLTSVSWYTHLNIPVMQKTNQIGGGTPQKVFV